MIRLRKDKLIKALNKLKKDNYATEEDNSFSIGDFRRIINDVEKVKFMKKKVNYDDCRAIGHDWCFKKDWKKEIDIADFGHIVIPVKCSRCKKEAFEVYEQMGYEDKDGEEIE